MDVQACAPLRISFAGGGTDVPPYPSTHGGAVLSATIARCARARVRARPDHQYHVESLDLMARAAFARHELVFNGHLDLVKAVLRDLAPQRGLDLTLATDAPPGSGLGSSSALVVAMLAAVGAAGGARWSPAELARRAYQAERVDLKIEGGMQDQYSAAYGGLNFMEFHGDDQVTVRSLEVAASTVEELERSLLLAWTGRSRIDDGILRRQVDGVLGGEARSLESLEAIKALALDMRDALLRGDLAAFADGLHQGWLRKRRLASGIATPWLDELYAVGRRAGAAGGKVPGAGGGGFLLFAVEPGRRARVAEALEAAGAPCTPVEFDFRGVRW
ncbi:MAG TPA: GHMP kinase [Actinomycetota bacterium]|nr:GHMP kinase [Actinomycetota bacterium]